MKTICITLALFVMSVSLYAQNEGNRFRLTLCAVFTSATSNIQQYNGTEVGSVVIHFRPNNDFSGGTYMEVQKTGPALSQFTSSKGSYTISSNKIQFNNDNGTVHVYTYTKVDNIITKLSAGERTLYFVSYDDH